MAARTGLSTSLGKDRQPCQTVSVIAVDVLASVAARGHVIQTASQFETQWTRHGGILRDCVTDCMTCPFYSPLDPWRCGRCLMLLAAV